MASNLNPWTVQNIESQKGKFAIVTGGTSGVGLEIARALAVQGADVLMAADHAVKGEAAVDSILESAPGASISYEYLDTSDLDSVSQFAHRRLKDERPIDILINNAGVAGSKERKLTPQGFEWCFATNYLGHFALTARLYPLLLRAPAARIVNSSSLAHATASLRFGDLQMEKRYSAANAYAQSKLATLLFAREIARRAEKEGLALKAMPVHPGGSRTALFQHGRLMRGLSVFSYFTHMNALTIAAAGQSAEQGALPALFAATAPEAESGTYYGPQGFREIRGYPGEAKIYSPGLDMRAADRLWRVSEQLTGLKFRLTPLQTVRSKVIPQKATPPFAPSPLH